jgi:hypothetical protein
MSQNIHSKRISILIIPSIPEHTEIKTSKSVLVLMHVK